MALHEYSHLFQAMPIPVLRQQIVLSGWQQEPELPHPQVSKLQIRLLQQMRQVLLEPREQWVRSEQKVKPKGLVQTLPKWLML